MAVTCYKNYGLQNVFSYRLHSLTTECVLLLQNVFSYYRWKQQCRSSCIYPKFAPQPLKEEYLLTDSLEPTNEWYAIAKITGVKACQAIRNQYNKEYVSLMPTNLYGSFDNFDLQSSHVLPAILRKFHEAKLNKNSDVILWGSGTPMREFLFVDDMAEAVVFALENNLPEYLYNIGTGKDITIKQLAETIQKVTGHQGEIIWDA